MGCYGLAGLRSDVHIYERNLVKQKGIHIDELVVVSKQSAQFFWSRLNQRSLNILPTKDRRLSVRPKVATWFLKSQLETTVTVPMMLNGGTPNNLQLIEEYNNTFMSSFTSRQPCCDWYGPGED